MHSEIIPALYNHYLASTGITTDTRNIANGNIFFALKGESFNANEFAGEAFEKGAAYVVVDEIFDEPLVKKFGAHLILVPDVLETMQQLAGFHRQHFKFPVLAITGSNGKTTTKELIAAVLAKKYTTRFTKGNLNNHIGIPVTLLSINKDEAEFAVIEMGANHVGEIASYCEYVQPDFGLITNVGMAHIEGFGSFEGVVKGKTELYRYLEKHEGKVFVNAENEILADAVNRLQLPVESKISYGSNAGTWCTGEIISGGEFLCLKTEGLGIETNLVGEYNFENVMSAVCTGKYFGVELKEIKDALESYVPTNNRSQKIMYGSNTVILDAYNANPSSMAGALKNFGNLLLEKPTNRAVVILGEMLELGTSANEEHKKIAELVLAETGKWQGVFVGDGFSFLKDENQVIWFQNTDALKQWFKNQQWENGYMLVKGSRKNELEKILRD